MPKLPTTRQSKPGSIAAKKRSADRRSLAHAFLTFTPGKRPVPSKSQYAQLQAEVGRLRSELECANAGNLSRRRLEGNVAGIVSF